MQAAPEQQFGPPLAGRDDEMKRLDHALTELPPKVIRSGARAAACPGERPEFER